MLKIVTYIGIATILSGCAWASRNIYVAPSVGQENVGKLIFENYSTGYINTIGILDTCNNYKMISSSHESNIETSAMYRKKLTVLMAYTAMGGSGRGAYITECKGQYDIEFLGGDLKIEMQMAGVNDRNSCEFWFSSRERSDAQWKRVDARKSDAIVNPVSMGFTDCKY